jgi:hypothetical protein
MRVRFLQTYILAMVLCCCTTAELNAQDSLPAFELQERNGMVIIGWVNPYPELTQMVIQRSYDSSNGFKSIMSMPDPSSRSNGYVDKALNASKQYYRLFYVQPGGRYFFTASAKPKKEILQLKKENINSTSSAESDANEAGEALANTQHNSIINILITRDKLTGAASVTTLDRVLPENIFTPSALIFSNKEGDLVIVLPNTPQKKYLLKVFKEDGSLVFSMKDIKDPQLLVDRSNFFHSGWFRYDLFEGDKLKEKNKFFIPPVN